MPMLLLSLFLTNPAPLEMPRAEAYLVRDGDRAYLEDRFDRLDLWTSRTVDGRWIDDEGRVFTLATLAVRPPALASGAAETRVQYAASCVPIDRRKRPQLREAVECLAPIAIAERPAPPRQLPRGFADVDYWQGTNGTALVCAFLPEASDVWRLATWTLADGDDIAAATEAFEDEFLRKEFGAWDGERRAADADGRDRSAPRERRRRAADASEAALLRRDARHSVAAYANWRTTDAAAFAILDDLPPDARAFVASLTNELPRLHRACAETLPTPLDGSNVLCVARLYASRAEYLAALDVEGHTNMEWSAAYWSPSRRELVAYLPDGDTSGLLKTIRHEAFHQYLSYATAMLPTSPWLNEGYAQFFEDPEARAWGADIDLTPEGLAQLADFLPTLFGLDYEALYAGTDEERRLKYRLAWSVAVFLEKGAPDVRFRPFKGVKRDYLAALLATRDPRQATAAAFRDSDTLKLFQSEWLRWWREHAR